MMKNKRIHKHSRVSGGKKCKNEKVKNAAIPHDIFLAHILPMIPQSDHEKAVMKAVKSQNVEDILPHRGCLLGQPS